MFLSAIEFLNSLISQTSSVKLLVKTHTGIALAIRLAVWIFFLNSAILVLSFEALDCIFLQGLALTFSILFDSILFCLISDTEKSEHLYSRKKNKKE